MTDVGRTRIGGRQQPFVVSPSSGVRIRTRLRVTETEDQALRAVGSFLGTCYRKELADRVDHGRMDRKSQAQWRAKKKRELTALTSSRWAGAITRAAEDQYQLGIRGLQQYVLSLDAAIATLAKRCAIDAGKRDEHGNRGYRDTAERHAKTRRLAALKQRLIQAKTQLHYQRPSVVVGGKRLWRNRNHLDDAGLTLPQWRDKWEASRTFLTADGETGKVGGNETIRVHPKTGLLRIKTPAALADQIGTHLIISAPVGFSHRGPQWQERITNNQAVRYDIVYDPQRRRWYLDASWTVPAVPIVQLSTIRQNRVIGVDLNDGHLDMCVVDRYGNAVGEPDTIDVAWHGLSASTRDGHVRAAITELLNRAESAGARAIVVENLDFADTRTTGRETMGRGRDAKRFRRTVAGIPTARFCNRLRNMAYERGINIVAVNPAYTSKAGKKYWRKPLQEQTKTSGRDVTGHHGASVTIARRGLGHKLSRHSTGPRNARRSIAGPPANHGENRTRGHTVRGKPRPRHRSLRETGPLRRQESRTGTQDRSGYD